MVIQSWLKNRFEHTFDILKCVLAFEILLSMYGKFYVCDMDNNWVLLLFTSCT